MIGVRHDGFFLYVQRLARTCFYNGCPLRFRSVIAFLSGQGLVPVGISPARLAACVIQASAQYR